MKLDKHDFYLLMFILLVCVFSFLSGIASFWMVSRNDKYSSPIGKYYNLPFGNTGKCVEYTHFRSAPAMYQCVWIDKDGRQLRAWFSHNEITDAHAYIKIDE